MIPVSEFRNAVAGALRLARFDPQAFNGFNRTLEGFWRSFVAAVIVGPLQLLLSFEVAGASGGAARVGEDWPLGLLAFAVHWLAFPVVMLSVVDWLDRRHRFFVFMVALNWSNLVQVGLLLLVYSPAASALLPPGLLRVVGAGAVAYILVYEWFIAKIGLDISGGKAVAIVLLDSLIGLAIFALASIGQH